MNRIEAQEFALTDGDGHVLALWTAAGGRARLEFHGGGGKPMLELGMGATELSGVVPLMPGPRLRFFQPGLDEARLSMDLEGTHSGVSQTFYSARPEGSTPVVRLGAMRGGDPSESRGSLQLGGPGQRRAYLRWSNEGLFEIITARPADPEPCTFAIDPEGRAQLSKGSSRTFMELGEVK
jgi:hypothetical protein